MSERGRRRWRTAAQALAAGGLVGCGPVDLSMTPARMALLVVIAGMVIAVAFGTRAGARHKDAARPGDAGAGFFVFAFLAAIVGLVIGTCNTFTAAPPAAPTAADLAPPPPPAAPAPAPAPPASPGCEDAVRAADRAFVALAEAHDEARTAATAADRACRVEALPPAASAARAGDAGAPRPGAAHP